jgi:hypothetical protein
MSLTTVIVLNALLDLGVVLAVAAIMVLPFTLDRRRVRSSASVYAFADPLPDDLAA